MHITPVPGSGGEGGGGGGSDGLSPQNPDERERECVCVPEPSLSHGPVMPSSANSHYLAQSALPRPAALDKCISRRSSLQIIVQRPPVKPAVCVQVLVRVASMDWGIS